MVNLALQNENLLFKNFNFTDTETHSSGISLMQIDCEVTDTRLINVKDHAIPQHFKPAGNATGSTTKHNKMNNGHNQKFKKPYKPYFMKKVNNSSLNLDKIT